MVLLRNPAVYLRILDALTRLFSPVSHRIGIHRRSTAPRLVPQASAVTDDGSAHPRRSPSIYITLAALPFESRERDSRESVGNSSESIRAAVQRPPRHGPTKSVFVDIRCHRVSAYRREAAIS